MSITNQFIERLPTEIKKKIFDEYFLPAFKINYIHNYYLNTTIFKWKYDINKIIKFYSIFCNNITKQQKANILINNIFCDIIEQSKFVNYIRYYFYENDDSDDEYSISQDIYKFNIYPQIVIQLIEHFLKTDFLAKWFYSLFYAIQYNETTFKYYEKYIIKIILKKRWFLCCVDDKHKTVEFMTALLQQITNKKQFEKILDKYVFNPRYHIPWIKDGTYYKYSIGYPHIRYMVVSENYFYATYNSVILKLLKQIPSIINCISLEYQSDYMIEITTDATIMAKKRFYKRAHKRK